MVDQLTFFAPLIPMHPSDWPEDYQSQFWSEYPLKISKRSAMRALDKAKDRNARWAELITGVHRYAAWLTAPEWRPSPKHPATWLNGERWNDEVLASANTVTLQRLPIAHKAINAPGQHGVEICAIGIKISARRVDHIGNRHNVFFKQSAGVRIGQHNRHL